jgi:hypothetical protein
MLKRSKNSNGKIPTGYRIGNVQLVSGYLFYLAPLDVINAAGKYYFQRHVDAVKAGAVTLK